MVKLAIEPEKLERLARILDEELGHELAFSVETGKIDVNRNGETGTIDLGDVEPGLAVVL